MKTLDELALEHGTDKSSEFHGFSRFYEFHLGPLREQPLTVLEIGVLEGASARMWRDYFPAAKILAIDFLESALEHEDERITIFIGDQTDRSFLDRVVAAAGPFDVVIDDGGHQHDEQLTSLFHLWPHVKPGGLYAIEDVHTSYMGRWGGRLGKPGTTMEELKKIVDDVNFHWHQQPTVLGEVESVHFYPELCVLTKRSAASRQRSGDPTKNPDLQTPDPPLPEPADE
jgi:hypothetical protein